MLFDRLGFRFSFHSPKKQLTCQLSKWHSKIVKMAWNLNSVKQWRYLESSSMTAIGIILFAKVMVQATLFTEYLNEHVNNNWQVYHNNNHQIYQSMNHISMLWYIFTHLWISNITMDITLLLFQIELVHSPLQFGILSHYHLHVYKDEVFNI